MKQLIKYLLIGFGGLYLSGCATKIDLFKYKDVSSLNVIDSSKDHAKVKKIAIYSDIKTSSKEKEHSQMLKDNFVLINADKGMFSITDKGDYSLKLTLQNIQCIRTYVPPGYRETSSQIYYTNPYWKYASSATIMAELKFPDGTVNYFSGLYDQVINKNQQLPITEKDYSKTIRLALYDMFEKMAKVLAPEAMVVSKKVAIKDDEDMVFMINMGIKDGLHSNQGINIYKEMLMKNEVDGETFMSKVLVGKAYVSDQLMDHYAWVVMNDEDKNLRVEIGDLVVPLY